MVDLASALRGELRWVLKDRLRPFGGCELRSGDDVLGTYEVDGFFGGGGTFAGPVSKPLRVSCTGILRPLWEIRVEAAPAPSARAAMKNLLGRGFTASWQAGDRTYDWGPTSALHDRRFELRDASGKTVLAVQKPWLRQARNKDVLRATVRVAPVLDPAETLAFVVLACAMP
jgi:hypothetical protein